MKSKCSAPISPSPADCTTHFVSTRAYGDVPGVLQDLSRFDTQSHGHYHVVYRDPDAANDLVSMVGDPNVSIEEAKAFTCNVRPGRVKR